VRGKYSLATFATSQHPATIVGAAAAVAVTIPLDITRPDGRQDRVL
jgi:hypothetical protein